MADYDYDLFVIGGGSGGVRAARLASQGGAKVALAEESRFGGTCVIRGCVPKKLMVYASSYREHFEDAKGFGWTVGETSFDWNAMRKARDAEIDRLEGIYEKNALQGNGVETFRARATILGPNRIGLIGGQEFTAKHILIATGGRPRMLKVEGMSLGIVSDDIFHLPELPERLTIVGAGYIACEFACIFNGLGSKVTLVNRSPNILSGFDKDVQEMVAEEMQKKGIDLMLGTVPAALTDLGGKGKRLICDQGKTIDGDAILMAVGRVANTTGLGLENVGIELGKREEIPVDEYSKTAADTIYAVGDVTERATLTPVAIREGAAFVETVFGGTPTKPDHDLIPTAVFTQPEIGTVGMTEAEARDGHEIEIYRATFKPMVHTLSGRDEKVLMKIIVDKATRKILGVHIVGHGSGELIQAVGIAVKMGATKEDFDATVAVHPTMAEELVTMKTPVAD